MYDAVLEAHPESFLARTGKMESILHEGRYREARESIIDLLEESPVDERLVADLCIHTREGVLSGVQEAVICRVQLTVRIGTAKLYAVFDRDGFLCFPSGDIHVQIGDSDDFSGMSVRAGGA